MTARRSWSVAQSVSSWPRFSALVGRGSAYLTSTHSVLSSQAAINSSNEVVVTPAMSLPPKSTPHMIWYRPFLAEVYLARLLALPSQLSDALVEGVVMDGVVVDGVVVVEGVMVAVWWNRRAYAGRPRRHRCGRPASGPS